MNSWSYNTDDNRNDDWFWIVERYTWYGRRLNNGPIPSYCECMIPCWCLLCRPSNSELLGHNYARRLSWLEIELEKYLKCQNAYSYMTQHSWQFRSGNSGTNVYVASIYTDILKNWGSTVYAFHGIYFLFLFIQVMTGQDTGEIFHISMDSFPEL